MFEWLKNFDCVPSRCGGPNPMPSAISSRPMPVGHVSRNEAQGLTFGAGPPSDPLAPPGAQAGTRQ